MTFESITIKHRDGTEIKTYASLNIPGTDYRLTLCTSKCAGLLRSIASVATHADGFVTMDLFGDYRATLAQSTARATAKAMAALHADALKSLQAHIELATAHTLAKEAKAEAARSDVADVELALSDANYVGSPMHY